MIFKLRVQIFGTQVLIYQIKNNNKVEELGFFILTEDGDDLICISQRNFYTIDLQYVLPIPVKLAKNKLDSILHVYWQNEEFIIQFESQFLRDSFQQALQHRIIDSTYKLQFKNQLSFLDNQIKNISGDQQEFNPKETKEILQKLRFELGEEYVHLLFFQGGLKTISLTQLKSKLPLLLEKSEIRGIFDTYCEFGKKITDQYTECMTLDEFKGFCQNEQKQVFKDSDYQELTKANSYNMLSFAQFAQILLTEENLIYDESKIEIYQDMNKPLNHYFISTSRKTLQFEQNFQKFKCLKSYRKNNPFEIPLIFAFECGARYLEINVWDGSDGEPICFYGPMMNFQVKLSKIFEVIRDHGFKYSEFPIIVGVEDHTSCSYRNSVVNIIEDVLGDQLQKAFDNKIQSPCELTRKVLLCRSIILNTIDEDEEWMIDEEEETDHRIKKNCTLQDLHVYSKALSSCRMKQQCDDFSSVSEHQMNMKHSIQSQNNLGSLKRYNHKQITPDYYFYEIIQGDELFNINSKHVIHQVKDWVIPSQVALDNTLQEKVKKQCQEGQFFKYAPRCKFTDSKNSYASQGFKCGISFIMIHHHIIDYDYMYYSARFQENGGQFSGYVLKNNHQELNKIRQKLFLTIISGNQLNHSRCEQGTNAFVQVILRTPILGQEDKIQQKCTKIEYNNSFNPQFNLIAEFEISDFGSSVLLFLVYHEDCENLLYWNSFYLPLIREGYRIVPLKDDYLNSKPGTNLFCKIEFV